MNKHVPKYHETFLPILRILEKHGTISTNALKGLVVREYYADLPKELLEEKTKTGQILVLNRIGWGKAYLKQGEYIKQPSRAVVEITEKGKGALKRGQLTLKELLKDKDFLRNRKQTTRSKGVEEEHETESPQDLIDTGFRSIEGQVKSDLLSRLRAIDPYYFQKVILLLLEKMGYGDRLETPKSGDGGIDGVINQDKLGLDKIYIQAKRYNDNKVRETEIRSFIGAMSRDANKGIFVTTSSFDDKAVHKARDAGQKIILIDGEMLADLMYRHGVGVQVRDTYEIKQVDEDFFDEESI